MTVAELLANKLQEQLGKKYIIKVNDAFNKTHINPIKSPYGTVYDVDFQTFAKDENKIIAVVQTNPSQLFSTPYRLDNALYTIQFWVPVDNYTWDLKGNLIKSRGIDFYGDMERIKQSLEGNVITASDGSNDLRMMLTMSEPTLASNYKERTGTGARVIYSINGNVSISDLTVGIGSDYGVAIVIEEQEYLFQNLTELNIVANSDGSALQIDGTPQTTEDIAALGQQVMFKINDVGDTPELAFLRTKLFENPTILSSDASTEAEKKQVLTRLYWKGALTTEFYGILSVQLNAPGNLGFSNFVVNITNGYLSKL